MMMIFSRNPSCALNVISTLLLHSVFQLVHYRSFITTANVSQFKFQSMTSTDKAAKMTIYVDCVTIIMLLKLKWNQFSSNLTGRHQFCLSVSTLLWEVIISSLWHLLVTYMLHEVLVFLKMWTCSSYYCLIYYCNCSFIVCLSII